MCNSSSRGRGPRISSTSWASIFPWRRTGGWRILLSRRLWDKLRDKPLPQALFSQSKPVSLMTSYRIWRVYNLIYHISTFPHIFHLSLPIENVLLQWALLYDNDTNRYKPVGLLSSIFVSLFCVRVVFNSYPL